MPKISVIVPIYKVEKYLNRCIDSILDQTYTDLEIILVDDGSPDGCPEICDEYAQKDKRIKVIHKENGGLSDARNAGLDIATGDYIGFVDSDDWIHPKMYEILYKIAVENNADIVSSNLRDKLEGDISQEREKEIIQNTEIFDAQEIYNHWYSKYMSKFSVSVYTKIYRKSIFESIRFEKGKIYEDVLIMMPTLLASTKVCIINVCLYFYFTNPQGIIHGKFNKNKFDILYAHKKRSSYFKDKKEHDIGMTVYYYCYTEFVIFTEIYAQQYRKYFKPYKNEMKTLIGDMLKNSQLCRLYKLTMLLTFISPKLSEKICKRWFQNVILTVKSFKKYL